MRFEDFRKKGDVRKASKDKALAKSLIENVKNDMKFLNKLKIDNYSSRKIMVSYYDILRAILESLAALDGFKIYSHEAFTYYLKEKGEEILSIKFDRYRRIRNSINYYGKDISIEEAEENVRDIKKMVDLLIKKYFGNFNEK